MTGVAQTPSASFTPAIPPPTGVTSNPEHPASLAYYSHLTTAICVPIVTTLFVLRTYVRVFIKKTWILEDYVTTTAWTGTIAYFGVMESVMAHGGGKHAWDITEEQFRASAYWFNVAAILYGVIVCVVKLAVLCLYKRVFAPKRWTPMHNIIIFLAVICIGFYASISLVKIFECSPRAKIYNPSIPGRCVDLSMILKTSGSFNFISDYLILLLPIHAVWKLRMSRRKKSLVVLVFTFGLCAPIFATIGFIVRMHNSDNRDKSWRQPQILLWGAAELSSGNLCVCFPELGPLLPKLLRAIPCAGQSHENNRQLEEALPRSETPLMVKPKGILHRYRQHRGRHNMDSGIGLSAYDRGRRTLGERVLPRGWMDSGIASHCTYNAPESRSTLGKQTKDVSPASQKSVGNRMDAARE